MRNVIQVCVYVEVLREGCVWLALLHERGRERKKVTSAVNERLATGLGVNQRRRRRVVATQKLKNVYECEWVAFVVVVRILAVLTG